MDEVAHIVKLLNEITDELEDLVSSLDKLYAERRPWGDSVAAAHQRRASNLVSEGLYLVEDGDRKVTSLRPGARPGARRAPRRRAAPPR